MTLDWLQATIAISFCAVWCAVFEIVFRSCLVRVPHTVGEFSSRAPRS